MNWKQYIHFMIILVVAFSLFILSYRYNIDYCYYYRITLVTPEATQMSSLAFPIVILSYLTSFVLVITGVVFYLKNKEMRALAIAALLILIVIYVLNILFIPVLTGSDYSSFQVCTQLIDI